MVGDLIKKIQEMPLGIYAHEASHLVLDAFVKNHSGHDFLVSHGPIKQDEDSPMQIQRLAFGTYPGSIVDMVRDIHAEGSIVFEISWDELDWNTMLNLLAVGRAPNVTIQLVHKNISKFHGYFKRDRAGNITYADAGSTNGSRVNGKRLPKENELVPVKSLTTICLGGQVMLTFYSPYDFYTKVLEKLK